MVLVTMGIPQLQFTDKMIDDPVVLVEKLVALRPLRV